MESPPPPPQQVRELRSLSPSVGFRAAEATPLQRRVALQFEGRRQVVRGLIAERDSSCSPSLRRRAIGRGPEGGESGQEEWDEEVVEEGPVRDLNQRRQLLQQAERARREEGMMASTAWSGPAFTGIGLPVRDHMDKVEQVFITNAAKLGRVPQVGETEYAVLDVTKKALFLQSCVQAVVDRLRRAELVGGADMRMEVQVGPVTGVNPR